MTESTDQPSKTPINDTVIACPSPDEWDHLLSHEGLTSSINAGLDAHVERCERCRAFLEARLAKPGLSLVAIACELDEGRIARRPPDLGGIVAPAGYRAVGEPIYGGRGLVFQAVHEATGSRVAIKISKFRHAANNAERQALKVEAEVISSLSHPNIVRVHEALPENDPPAIVMEWVEGGTLADRLVTTRPTVVEIVALMKQLAGAVGHAHARRVLHRDIKPSNILMSGERFADAKLSDFGLAKLGREDVGWSTATEFIGTPVYMAPESFRQEYGKLGPTVDIYSLGAIFYRLLTGKTPFEGANAIELGMRVVKDEVTPVRRYRKDVPKDLETICLKCLRKEPEERYPDANSLMADLTRFEEGRPIRANRDNSLKRWRRWAKRDPKAAAQALGFVSFLICVILALAVMLERSVESERRAIANEKIAGDRFSESLKAMSLASPIFKRALIESKLKPDEVRKVVEFASMRSNPQFEPVDLKERLDHHYLTLELADSLIKIPGQESKSIELAGLARLKIKEFIDQNAEAASRIFYYNNRRTGFRQTLLETALIRYSYACSQLYNAYPDPGRIDIGMPVPIEDPEQSLIKEAIATAERVLKLNPKLTEPKGQLADYHVVIAEHQVYMGRRDAAVEHQSLAVQISEQIRDDYMQDPDRWRPARSHRELLARIYLEPPAKINEFEETLKPFKDLLKSDFVNQHAKRDEIDLMLWWSAAIDYLPFAATGKYQAALEKIDNIIKLTPSIDEHNMESVMSRRQVLARMSVDRLNILQVLSEESRGVEIAEDIYEAELNQLTNQMEKTLARVYFDLFRPTMHKRDPKAALQRLEPIQNKPPEWQALFMLCKLMTGDTKAEIPSAKLVIDPKRRCAGNFMEFHLPIFEAEILARQGKALEAVNRLKSIEKNLDEDMLVPFFLRTRFHEIKRMLNEIPTPP